MPKKEKHKNQENYSSSLKPSIKTPRHPKMYARTKKNKTFAPKVKPGSKCTFLVQNVWSLGWLAKKNIK